MCVCVWVYMCVCDTAGSPISWCAWECTGVTVITGRRLRGKFMMRVAHNTPHHLGAGLWPAAQKIGNVNIGMGFGMARYDRLHGWDQNKPLLWEILDTLTWLMNMVMGSTDQGCQHGNDNNLRCDLYHHCPVHIRPCYTWSMIHGGVLGQLTKWAWVEPGTTSLCHQCNDNDDSNHHHHPKHHHHRHSKHHHHRHHDDPEHMGGFDKQSWGEPGQLTPCWWWWWWASIIMNTIINTIIMIMMIITINRISPGGWFWQAEQGGPWCHICQWRLCTDLHFAFHSHHHHHHHQFGKYLK